ncbi:putative FAS-associated death domain protein-like [Scophthalmus maximus]|uniref:Putative FAS-associated death domain protein-like n=1 Tax=Scophthalmus maximus TaxID=52904 RepID=A0A2U9BEB3_SCOMX|nr:putative FAS-associated death domain protein-like [Scophthalmus maximus]
MSSLQFNSVLLEISNQLSGDELDKMKFLCRDKIGKKDMEKISSGVRLFQLLTERGELGAEKPEFLSKCLEHIRRRDLADMLQSFESPCGIGSHPDREETEVIAENLGKMWRKLGRKLGLNEVKLESIYRRHPTDLEETVVELLKDWRKSRGAEAQTNELLKALRDCQFNLTAAKVEDKLADTGY